MKRGTDSGIEDCRNEGVCVTSLRDVLPIGAASG